MTLVWSYMLATRADVRHEVGLTGGVRRAFNPRKSRFIVAGVYSPVIDRDAKWLKFADEWVVKRRLDYVF